MRITIFTFAAVMLLLAIPQLRANGDEDQPQSLDQTALRTTLDQYINSVKNLHCEADVANIVRLSSGRISERNFSVEFTMRDYVVKISQFSRGTVEDEQGWFDIRETLIFPSGSTAEWRHPGFPGQITFGHSSNESKQIRHAAGGIGDPLFPLKKIASVMLRDSFHVVENHPESVVAHVSVPGTSADSADETGSEDTDYIEIEFEKKYGWLPVSMTRICVQSDANDVFDSGGAFEIEYGVTDTNTVVPQVIRQDTRLKDDVEGSLATTWTFKTFDLSVTPTMDEMKLTLPVQVLAENVDSHRRFTVTSKDDDAAATLKKSFGEFIEIQPGKAAMQAVAKSFVGQCPDLPAQYQLLRQQNAPALAASSTSGWNACLLAAHGVGLWVIAGYWRRRYRPAVHDETKSSQN